MRERFTVGARSAIRQACAEAERFEHRFVDTEHLLLGLISEGEAPAVVTLTRLGVPLETVRDDLERVLAADLPDHVEEGFTDRARRVLALAAEEARELGHRQIGIEDLFLGILRDGETAAARILAEFLGGPRSRIPVAILDLLARSPRWLAGTRRGLLAPAASRLG